MTDDYLQYTMKWRHQSVDDKVDANENIVQVSRQLGSGEDSNSDRMLLTAEEVLSEFREPFIKSGYRKPYMSAKDCVRSLTQPTNETFNFYSSSLFGFVFVDFMRVAFTNIDLDDDYYYPFFVCVICAMIISFVSAGAHLFNAMSIRVRHICFYCDYAALSVYSMGAGMTFYFYCRPMDALDNFLFSSPFRFLGVSFIFACLLTICCCMTRLHWQAHRYIIRSSAFFLPFLYNSSPFLIRNLTCRPGLDCNSEGLFYLNLNFFLYVLSGLLNGLRIPERLAPGEFDIFGNSHHYLHVIASTAALCHLMGIEAELKRRPIVEDPLDATILYTAGLLVLAVLCNVGIVVWFALRTPSDEKIREMTKTRK